MLLLLLLPLALDHFQHTCVAARLALLQSAPAEKNKPPIENIFYLQNFSKFFSRSLHHVQRRIQATYSANFIALFGLI